MNDLERVDLEKLPCEWRDLADVALSAREHAYAPYSGFAVGAAVRTSTGKIYSGSNIENASYGLTVCAERVAIWKAVAAGDVTIDALVVATENGASPCGACRQVMAEFAQDLPLLIVDSSGGAWHTSLAELLPNSFRPKHLPPIAE